ncbi:MAG: leucine-rich repeat protein [Clostridia bacterium]|nr:leucine-rich repeat protein [Clostridia bacterium]
MLSTAAYKRGEVVDLLADGMGYRILDSGESYTIDRSIDYNDIVAYTIAEKDIADYRVYCVVVRGTGKNAEWFSDFNLGENNGGNHLGFHKAAGQVWEELEPLLANDGADAAHRVVWVTGHSRGAAVSNILGAWLNQSSYVQRQHMFCYTFACPAVSKQVVNYSNIHNFNNLGDVVTVVPLEDWGYGRYGVDHIINPKGRANTLRRYAMAAGHAYRGMTNTDGVVEALKTLVPEESAYYDNMRQLLILCIPNSMAEEDSVDFNVLAERCHLKETLTIGLIESVVRGSGLSYVNKTLRQTREVYDDLISQIAEVTANYDPEKGPFLEQIGNVLVGTLLAETGVVVNNLTTLGQARQKLEKAVDFMDDASQLASGVVDALYQSNGELLDSIGDAHDSPIYNVWANDQYFGYRGWIESDATAAHLAASNAEITSVGKSCFANCAQLESLTGLDALRAVGNEAFAQSGLRGTLELPETLEWVGDSAFDGCAGLDVLALPAGLKHLGHFAFNGCEGLRTVTLPIELSISEVFNGCTGVETIYYLAGSDGVMPDRSADSSLPDGEEWYVTTLENQSSNALKAVAFEEGCTHIGNMAFLPDGEGRLEVLILPTTLKSIGNLAFNGQSALAVPLEFPEGFTTLGEGAFYESGVTAVTLPEGVEEIPEACFYSCTGLAEIHLPESLKRIGSLALTATAIERLDLPRGLEAIGEGAFSSCEQLAEVSAPAELEWNSADEYLKSGTVKTLRLLRGSDGVMPDYDSQRSIVERFSAGSLETVEFEEGITHVGDYAFWATSGGALRDVKLPSTLQSIGDGAFAGHSSLKGIELPEGLSSLGASAFARTGLETLTLPAGLTYVGAYCFDDAINLRYIRFLGNAPAFGTLDDEPGEAFPGLMAEAVYPAAGAGWTAAARASAGGNLFWHPDELSTLTLPSGLRKIGEEAFVGVDAGRVVIAEGTTSIDRRAFADMSQPCVVFHIPASVEQFGEACLPFGSIVYTPEGSAAWEWFTELGGNYLCVPES